jgi:hypothetical protein
MRSTRESRKAIPASLAFRFVRVENILVIFQSMCEAGRWRVGLRHTGVTQERS